VSIQSNKLPPLEEALTEMTQIIDKMEHSELTLDQSLNEFERGISLVKHCQKILEEAELKVKKLMKNNNTHADELKPYDEENQPE